MPTRSSSGARDAGASTPAEVDALLAALDHPQKDVIVAVRQVILGAEASIREGVKWNAPSFRTTEWFATFHLRAKDGVRVIMHFGAKQGGGKGARGVVRDPDALLEWLADDRAAVRFADMADVDAKRAAFAAVIREWLPYV